MDHYRPEIASSCQSVKQGQYIWRQERQTHEQTHRHRHPIPWVQRQPGTKVNEHTHDLLKSCTSGLENFITATVLG